MTHWTRSLVGLAALGALASCGGQVNTGTGGAGGSTTGSNTTGSNTNTSTTTTGGCTGCSAGLNCCGSLCANLQNDPHNCGACGTVCSGTTSYCHLGQCIVPPCTVNCGPNCCGDKCCAAGQLCCDISAGAAQFGQCTDPDANGSCPPGCPACVCASPETPIATPRGEVPIAELSAGDLVYSVDHDAVVAVPILRINRAPAHDHHVMRVSLENGRVLSISAPHPTADGRTFGDLRAGGTLDGAAITRVEVVPYQHPFTYDILPASDTGTYYAAGLRIGSTLPR